MNSSITAKLKIKTQNLILCLQFKAGGVCLSPIDQLTPNPADKVAVADEH
jgi:hypothetical protein